MLKQWFALKPCRFRPGRFGGMPPVLCEGSVLAYLQAISFPYLLHRLATSDSSADNLLTTNTCYRQPQRAGHEPVCLVPEWTSICLCLSGVFAQASTHILRASYSSDIGVTTNTTSDCQPRPNSQRQPLRLFLSRFRLQRFYMTVNIASEMHSNAFQCIAQPNTTFA